MRNSVPQHVMGSDRPRVRFALLLLLCSATVAAGASDVARGIRPAMTIVGDQSLPPLHLSSHIVKADIQGRVARVSAESVYHNDTTQQLEATYVFPLPDGAAVDRFVMWMNGEPVEAVVAEKELARRTYEQIVHRRKDPGLLEQVAENTFRYRIFPILPGSDQKIRIEYSVVLPLTDNGTIVHFDCPLAAPDKRDATPMVAKNFVVAVNIEMDAPIAAITSSSHHINPHIQEADPRKARASIEELHSALDRDFALNIQLQGRAAPITALAYRRAPTAGAQPKADDGTVMLLITPELIETQEPATKDLVMVMDISGSMEGVKIEQARAALRTCLSRLKAGDRFAIESFSDEVTPFRNDWCSVTPENIDAALHFVNGLNAGGATNIEGAIRRALAFKGQPGRLRQVLFATDGEPTIGEMDVNKLANLAADKSGDNAEIPTRFFTFGIGYDVNALLLDKIAALTHGDRAYVRPQEDIARKVGDLCDKIAAPVLTDATLTFSSNLTVQHIYPPQLNDLYLGRQVVVTATYNAPGTGTVTIKGKRGGKDVAIEAPLTLPESTPAATSFLPKQWAIRKVGFLLDQIRLHGENVELKNEVIRLGTLHGIVTPYTSYLALEAQDRRNFQAQQQAEQARKQAQLNAQTQPAASNRVTKMAAGSPHDTPPTDPTSKESSDIIVPPDILAKAQLGDHWEVTNPDRPDTHSAFPNPNDGAPGVGGMDGAGTSEENLIGVGGGTSRGSGGGFGGGNGTGTGVDNGAGRGSFGERNGGGRRIMVQRHGGSKATENSVDVALRWLADHQEADGHFDGEKFGAAKSDTAITSLALLSYLGAGHTEKVGTWKDNVQHAVKWLIEHQDKDGIIGGGAVLNDQHLLAALALSEAAGMARVPATMAAAQKAIDSFTPDRIGGITLISSPGLDSSSLVWCVMAMKSARTAGVHVDHASFDSAITKLGACEQKNGTVSRFGDAKDAKPDVHATAAGLLCEMWMGWKAEDLRESVETMINADGHTPEWADADPRLWYFVTQLVFQQGGDLWKRWNEGMKKALTENQLKQGDDAGSWNIPGATAAPFGRVGQTALCCLCLETYYRYKQLNDSARTYTNTAPAAQQVQAPPAAAPASAPKPAETGKEGVDYSEYIRQLQDGIDPAKK